MSLGLGRFIYIMREEPDLVVLDTEYTFRITWKDFLKHKALHGSAQTNK